MVLTYPHGDAKDGLSKLFAKIFDCLAAWFPHLLANIVVRFETMKVQYLDLAKHIVPFFNTPVRLPIPKIVHLLHRLIVEFQIRSLVGRGWMVEGGIVLMTENKGTEILIRFSHVWYIHQCDSRIQ